MEKIHKLKLVLARELIVNNLLSVCRIKLDYVELGYYFRDMKQINRRVKIKENFLIFFLNFNVNVLASYRY